MGGELISTEELAQILHETDVRIFDCTTRLDYQPPGSDIPYIPVPGLDTFVDAHIPGADFLDIQREFSDQHTKLHFMMAPFLQRVDDKWAISRLASRVAA
jgi:thiosulfate/3-mercaptopyruvate sulfurtransferase